MPSIIVNMAVFVVLFCWGVCSCCGFFVVVLVCFVLCCVFLLFVFVVGFVLFVWVWGFFLGGVFGFPHPPDTN